MEKFEMLGAIGEGNFGVARLMRNKETKELVAVKCIERGEKIDQNVAREIMNHRSLRHPNIIRFKEVVLTRTHLAIVMEYASGGEIFNKICCVGRFSENEARYYFQQLICGVSYCHQMQICHRDLKLENILLDGSPMPKLKICDFGYSKSSILHSMPKSTVGTPAYIAPEIFSRKEYDGKMADVWSCGVSLYIMLVGSYPFEDPNDPKNFKTMIQKITSAQYTIPDNMLISQDCTELLARIFVLNPTKRITMKEIKNHPWFLKNLPIDLTDAAQAMYYKRGNKASMHSHQVADNIMKIVHEARTRGPSSKPLASFRWVEGENDDEEEGKVNDVSGDMKMDELEAKHQETNERNRIDNFSESFAASTRITAARPTPPLRAIQTARSATC